MMKRQAVDWFVDALARRGVEWMASLCGHGQDPLYHAWRRAGLRIVDVRNEQTAAGIAEAYGRLTRRPGVCSVSSGVAVANGLTGVLNAWFDGAPMLMISGSHDVTSLGMGCFQDLDQVELCRSITKFSRLLDVPARVVQVVDEAFERAQAEPPGPVHLTFPMDVQRTEVGEGDLAKANWRGENNGASAERVSEVAARLARASRPLIIAGSGVYYAGQGADLMACAEAWAIPVQTPIWDRGVTDAVSEAFVGVIGAASGGPPLLAQSDCVILAGAAVDYRLGYLQAGEPVVRLTRGWRQLGEALAQNGSKPFGPWLEEARKQRQTYGEKIEAEGRSQAVNGKTHSIHITQALAEAMPPEAALVIDAGSVGQWAHQLLADRRYPHYWLTCGRSGVVGYGLAGAMAARLAFPSRPVVLLAGDGAFTFTVAEIECAVRQKLNFVAIVADDLLWGITHTGHVRQFGEGISTQLGPIRFDLLAESMGARGRRAASPVAIATELRQALAFDGVTVLHVPVVGGNPV